MKQLVSDHLLAGQHSIIWNGKDDINEVGTEYYPVCQLTRKTQVELTVEIN